MLWGSRGYNPYLRGVWAIAVPCFAGTSKEVVVPVLIFIIDVHETSDRHPRQARTSQAHERMVRQREMAKNRCN